MYHCMIKALVIYCIPANISMRDIIAKLALQASLYLIQHGIIRKLSLRASTCLYRASIGMPYTVEKLLNSAILLRGGSLLEILNYLPDGGHFSRVPMWFQIQGKSQFRYMSGTWMKILGSEQLAFFFILFHFCNLPKSPPKRRNEYPGKRPYKMTFIPVFPTYWKSPSKRQNEYPGNSPFETTFTLFSSSVTKRYSKFSCRYNWVEKIFEYTSHDTNILVHCF